jgi:hypothetical protein
MSPSVAYMFDIQHVLNPWRTDSNGMPSHEVFIHSSINTCNSFSSFAATVSEQFPGSKHSSIQALQMILE